LVFKPKKKIINREGEGDDFYYSPFANLGASLSSPALPPLLQLQGINFFSFSYFI
jgi:hypothetical protein